MKIGIDIQSIEKESTGIGYYTKNLIREYKKSTGIDFFYYSNLKSSMDTIERLTWENISLPKKFRKDKIDIFHITGFAGPYRKEKFIKIITVHDLIGLIYPHNLGVLSRFYWQKWLPLSIKNSDIIIADSENTKRDIVTLLKIPEKKIRVVYLAASDSFKPLDKKNIKSDILNKYGIKGKYILNVGTVEPRKNIVNLIVSFNEYLIESKRNDISLVIVGKKAWDYKKCCEKVKDLHLEDKVLFCGYTDREDLPIIYNCAEAFVYVSLYEGFGLPVLEAMNCGLPVVCSQSPALKEIFGDAVYLIDPNSIENISFAITEVLEKETIRKDLSYKALSKAREFSWEKTAQNTIKVYREALG